MGTLLKFLRVNDKFIHEGVLYRKLNTKRNRDLGWQNAERQSDYTIHYVPSFVEVEPSDEYWMERRQPIVSVPIIKNQ